MHTPEMTHLSPEVLDNLDLFVYAWNPNDKTPQLSYRSPALLALTGYSLSSFSDPGFWLSIVHPDDQPLARNNLDHLEQGEKCQSEYRIIAKNGDVIWVADTAVPIRDAGGTIVRIEGVLTNITEWKKLLASIRESEERYRQLIDTLPEAIIIHQQGTIVFINSAAIALLGAQNARDLVGHHLFSFIPFDHLSPVHPGTKRGPEERKISTYIEEKATRLDGTILDIEVTSLPVSYGGKPAGMLVVSDITERTERKRVERELQQAEEKFRLLVEQIPAITYIDTVDEISSTLYMSPQVDPLLGYSPQEWIEDPNLWVNLLHPEDRQLALAEHARTNATGNPFSLEYRLIHKDGHAVWFRDQAILIRDEHGRPQCWLGFLLEITERKTAEEAQRLSEQRYRILIERNLAGVFRTTPEGRILDCNDAFAQILGYENREEVLSEPADQFYENEKDRKQFVAHLLEEGSVSNAEVLIQRRDGKKIWILENANLIVGEPGTPAIIQGTVIDITERKQSQQLLEQSLLKLRRAFDQTVQALVSLAEMRDPYAAGHQTRVSLLASAIAQEMSLPEEEIESIRVAGVLHDIGKIYVPAEILSKPGNLSPIEYALVQSHAQASFDILKPIEFPWPIAEMVLQHHERLDGSGYPQGLRDEEICPAARILAVADVVEAMSSHRPYRPAHGGEKALAEIEENCGRLYDPVVVEACLRLFRQRHFTFD